MFYSGLRIHTDGVRVPRPLAPPPERTRRARAGIAIIAVAAGVALAWHAAGLVALIVMWLNGLQ